jgi:hypothetical protein
MFLLVPFLALAVAFLLFALLSFRADLAERKQCRRISLWSKGRPFSVLSLADAFDQDHTLIWETQIPALQQIAAAGRKGVPLERLYLQYAQSARVYPELYDGSSFGRWIEFLEKAQLITLHRHRVFLTLEGHQFVKNWVTTEASSAPTNRVA